jgi:hypothetical protein
MLRLLELYQRVCGERFSTDRCQNHIYLTVAIKLKFNDHIITPQRFIRGTQYDEDIKHFLNYSSLYFECRKPLIPMAYLVFSCFPLS